MLMESLVISRYTYAFTMSRVQPLARDCLALLDCLQNRTVLLTCGLRKYDHVSRSWVAACVSVYTV